MKLISTIVLLVIAMSGCQTTTPPPLEGDSEQSAQPSDYKVGVGDVLDVSVWRNPELSVTVPVRPDGKISVPLIGDVEARGFAPQQVASNVEQALREFVRDPHVSVIVTSINNTDYTDRVRITGAVQKPLSLPYEAGMTVLDLVLEAGGPTEFANTKRATLYRGSEAYSIDLGDLLNRGDLRTNYALRPGDVITVGERAF